MSKMIKIKGKEISEDTIIEALKKHKNFEAKKEPKLKHGDIIFDMICKMNLVVMKTQDEKKWPISEDGFVGYYDVGYYDNSKRNNPQHVLDWGKIIGNVFER